MEIPLLPSHPTGEPLRESLGQPSCHVLALCRLQKLGHSFDLASSFITKVESGLGPISSSAQHVSLPHRSGMCTVHAYQGILSYFRRRESDLLLCALLRSLASLARYSAHCSLLLVSLKKKIASGGRKYVRLFKGRPPIDCLCRPQWHWRRWAYSKKTLSKRSSGG
jgi:hypothetical protein